MAVIVAMPAAFPVMESASFFSNALVEPKQPFSIADLYFTSNPFHSLSNAVIPAVVLFSSMIGIGLIGLDNRESVLDTLRVLNASIIRITRFIVSLTPIGVFAIGAVTAGTMPPETFVKLEVYFITFGAASLLLAFLVLPLLVTALTPFRYWEVIGIGREALLTAFVANNAFIGYDPANLPFSFFNLDDELVGFDIELAENLAESFGVRAEFIPIEWRELPEMLADGVIDVMPGTWYRPFWFPSLRLSAPYMTGTMGLAVRDERRHEFDSVEALHRSQGLKIGVPLDISQVQYSMERYFGNADVEFVTLEFWQPFFEGEHPELDAFLVPAEHGAAWTLLHPAYTVVVPQPNPVKIPSAFGLALDASELADTVNEWVVFASNGDTIQRAYDYWILGKGAEAKRPRWSIVRGVLGWVE